MIRLKEGGILVPINFSDRRIYSQGGYFEKSGVKIQGKFGMEVFFVGFDPIRSNVMLRRGEIEFSGANEFVKTVLQRVFDMRIPDSLGVRFRP